MSGPLPDVHGSAITTAEPHLQSRLVLAVDEKKSNADNEASLSFPNTEQDTTLDSKSDHAPFQSTHSIPASSDVDDDGRMATEDEVRDLLHVVDNVPSRVWLACIAGILERFVWYGATAPLQNYLQNAPGGEVPGALGLGQATASNIVNVLFIASYITPVPAAVIADSWLGRHKTMIYAAIIEAVGATILFGTSLPVAIREGAALGGVIAACILMSIGSGAFNATVVPFIADQYDDEEFRIRMKKGQKVVSDRELTITYIYNVYYWTINIVGFLADSTPLLERYVGFWVAYLVPCCAMWLALLPVLFGRHYFIRVVPTTNIMPQVCTALRLGIAGGFKMDAAKPDAQLQQHSRQVPWTDSFIEDIKLSLLTSRVLLLFPIHWLCYNQTFNNLISQAGQMVTYGIPNDMMKVAGAISGIIVAPIIQKGLYPFLTKRKVSFGPIARMTVGFLVLAFAMAYTTGVQKLIYQSGPCYDNPLACAAAKDRTIPNQVSVFLQIPIYFGGSLAEVFCFTTGTEYAYNKAPKNMKTLVQAIWLGMGGIGACLALAFTPLTRDPHLVTMYAILTGLLGGAGVLLYVLFRRLDKAKVKEDAE
ncbi:cytochrome P450 monooxygenase [Penicillium atrosanguineum]|uniref:Proton-dependent oligopeptide transporter family n=1 Tax=Penicillium atrosanguineum TaxID=1132637 RepID=A0A9W9Q3M7_9EURO|nr:cytochrome P450 monooxygenase [Penicillium atrosanguineum]KAJ5304331.1 cytochrome P450 monooxygenase [Penicillium atrosanguineum]KAJ5323804.1 Proton-dependent oligopeptide transporter family [Penicillium atrosanguineum]